MALSDGIDCTLVDLPFKHNGSQLDYDEESGTYLYSEYGSKHLDPGNDNKQLAFKNVILQKMSYSQLDEHGYMVWNCLASGQGRLLHHQRQGDSNHLDQELCA